MDDLSKCINSNIGLVHFCAQKWQAMWKAKTSPHRMFHRPKHTYRDVVEYEDMVQVGTLGLIKAHERYDPNYGTKFSTYAVHWINRSIQSLFQQQLGSAVRIPVYVLDEIKKWKPQPEDNDEVLKYEWTRHLIHSSRYPIRLSSSTHRGVREQGSGGFLADSIEQKREQDPAKKLEDDARTLMEKTALKKALEEQVLSSKEDQVIRNRYGFLGARQKTLQEIGDEMGFSREYIRLLESRALEKLRRYVKRMAHTGGGS